MINIMLREAVLPIHPSSTENPLLLDLTDTTNASDQCDQKEHSDQDGRGGMAGDGSKPMDERAYRRKGNVESEKGTESTFSKVRANKSTSKGHEGGPTGDRASNRTGKKTAIGAVEGAVLKGKFLDFHDQSVVKVSAAAEQCAHNEHQWSCMLKTLYENLPETFSILPLANTGMR